MTDQVSAWNLEAWRRHLPQDVDVERLDLLENDTLLQAWRARWAEAPLEVALIDLAPDGRTLTRADVDRETAAMAATLHLRGVRPGNRVLMSARASTNFILLYIAALRLGAVVVPVNTAYRERE